MDQKTVETTPRKRVNGWVVYTLALLLIAGVATTSALANTGAEPAAKECATKEAKAEGKCCKASKGEAAAKAASEPQAGDIVLAADKSEAKGEACDSKEAKACDKDKKECCSKDKAAKADGAACDASKEAKAGDKECCSKDKAKAEAKADEDTKVSKAE